MALRDGALALDLIEADRVQHVHHQERRELGALVGDPRADDRVGAADLAEQVLQDRQRHGDAGAGAHAAGLLDLRELGEALEIGFVEAVLEQRRIVPGAGGLEHLPVLVGEGAVGGLPGDAVVMRLQGRTGAAAHARRTPLHGVEDAGVDLEGAQPRLDLVTERHGASDPGARARRQGTAES